MRIYWTLKSIPELQSVPKAERGRIWRRGYVKSFRHWQTWVGLLLAALCAGVGIAVGGIWGGGIGGGFGGFLFSQIVIPVTRPYLEEELNK